MRDHLYLDLVGRDSFYGQLATALLLHAHERVSDAEAHRQARVDLSWKVA